MKITKMDTTKERTTLGDLEEGDCFILALESNECAELCMVVRLTGVVDNPYVAHVRLSDGEIMQTDRWTKVIPIPNAEITWSMP